MIERLRNGFHQVYLFFNNFVIVLSIPIILALSLASGYTTFHGMNIYVPSQWIAGIITFAVQAVIIIASIELGKAHIRANILRFAGLIVSLIIGLAVSMFFSYFTFFENAESAGTKEKKFNQLNAAINEYIANAWESKTEIILKKEEQIKIAQKEVDDAFWGRSKDTPGKMQKPGKGQLYRYYKEKLDREESGLNAVKAQFEDIQAQEKELRYALAQLSMAEVGTPAGYAEATRPVYEKIRQQFAALTGLFEHVFSDNGISPVRIPSIMPHDMYVKMTPTLGDITENPIAPLPLCLAVVIDVLTFVLSYRLQVVPMGTLFEDQKQFVYKHLKAFSKWHINRNDHLEFGIERSPDEESTGYNDGPRKFAAATLLNLGFIRRVKKSSAEFTSFFYPIVMEELIKEQQHFRQAGTSSGKSRGNEEQGAGNDPDLQIVYRKTLFSGKYIPKPAKIRFYDKVIDLSVERMDVGGEYAVLGGLISLDFRLTVFFQATLDYVRRIFGKTPVANVNIAETVRKKYKDVLKQVVINTVKHSEDSIRSSKNSVQLSYHAEKLRQEIEYEVNACLQDKALGCSANCVLNLSFKKLFDEKDKEKIPGALIYKELYEHIDLLEKNFRRDIQEKEFAAEDDIRRKERERRLEDTRHEAEILEAEAKENEKKRGIRLSEESARYEFEKKMKKIETDFRIFLKNEAEREEAEKKRLELKNKFELIEDESRFVDNTIELPGKEKLRLRSDGEARPYPGEKKQKVS